MATIKEGYKQTELGLIPADWEIITLGQVAPLQRGFDLPNAQLKKGNFPVVYSNGIGNHHISFMCKGPGVITGRSGTIGRVHYIEQNYWPHNTSLWVTNFNNNYPKFIYYLYIYLKLERFGSGSGVPTLNRNDVHEYKIALPPLPEQRAIADALRAVDDLLTSLDQLIAKKQAIKQAAMQQLLTGQTRLPRFATHQPPRPTELGPLPSDWEVKKLGKILKVRHGKSQKGLERADGEFSIYGTGGEMGRTNHFIYDQPSVLIGRKGTIDKPRYIDKPFWTIDTLFYTEIFTQVDPLFVFYKFQMIDWRNYNEASGVPSLNASTIENILISSPLLAEQQAIAEVLGGMDADIEAVQAQRAKTEAIKQGMMQELLTGRTRLPY